MFDPKCYELALHFLPSGITHERVSKLSQHIQDSVETWLQIERDHLQDQIEAAMRKASRDSAALRDDARLDPDVMNKPATI